METALFTDPFSPSPFSPPHLLPVGPEAPFDTQDVRHYHLHIETMPSLTMAAGFEWGTGFYGNPVVPEEAAALLRMVEVEAVES